MAVRGPVWFISGVVVLGLAGIAGARAGAFEVVPAAGLVDGRAVINLEQLIRPDAGTSAFLPDGRVATSEYCSGGTDCVQALDSETAIVRKYATQEDARAAVAELGNDAHLSGWIVVQYKPGGLTSTEQRSLEQGIDGINVDSPD